MLAASSAAAQPVTRIHVESFSGGPDDALREEMIRQLKAQKDIAIVPDQARADRVLAGINHMFVKGYLSPNPRLRYRNSDSRPVYGGYVSVELKDRQDDTVWSYLVTPRRFDAEDIKRNVTDQIVAKLLQFLADPSKTP